MMRVRLASGERSFLSAISGSVGIKSFAFEEVDDDEHNGYNHEHSEADGLACSDSDLTKDGIEHE